MRLLAPRTERPAVMREVRKPGLLFVYLVCLVCLFERD